MNNNSLVDDAEGVEFAFEQSLPEEVMKPSKRPICKNFQKGSCSVPNCPDRHTKKGVVQSVCRFWLRGVCTEGDDCSYIHEYDEKNIPDCDFYQKVGECTNPECFFQHLPQKPRCASYDRGFCPLGPNCELRHVRRELCPYYMIGFCPLGPQCPKGHPVNRLYNHTAVEERLRLCVTNPYTCYKCFDPGHLPATCPGVKQGAMYKALMTVKEPGEQERFSREGLCKTCCFKCGKEGHVIKDCPMKKLEQSSGA